jgi:uncharacterized protein (DUF1697 family)
MTVYVGLLRAVNVAGSSPLSMAALSALMSRQGFENVHTILQSGNVVFHSDSAHVVGLERIIQRALSDRLGLSTDVFLRTASDWRSIVKRNPFPREAQADPAHLVVTILKGSPTAQEWRSLMEAIHGRERVRAGGRHAYIVYPDGIGRSKLTAALIERKLSTRGTSRNWNTVQKLDQIASP